MLRSIFLAAVLLSSACSGSTAQPDTTKSAEAHKKGEKGEGKNKGEKSPEAAPKAEAEKPEKPEAGPKKEQQIPLVPGTTAEALLAKLAGKGAPTQRPAECHEVTYGSFSKPADAIKSYVRVRRTTPVPEATCTAVAAPESVDVALKWTSAAAFEKPAAPTVATTSTDAKHPALKVEEDRLYAAGAAAPTLRYGFADKLKWSGEPAKQYTSADVAKAAFTTSAAPEWGCKPLLVLETRYKIDGQIWSLEVSTIGTQQIVELSSETAKDEAATALVALLGDLVAKEKASPVDLAIASCSAK